ncbi:hypothetical protein [Saccharothrix variisporea]|uniref:Secreted protein n=1 Tax=Saccharothrix variisporea TaxID=543527 RepID=A0A495X777_9PSEU|nr:hypothetical protein [Saccharothrix variisporea]RKT69980.1 hypothetical protein DFJ66_3221 [Saccharothrix variisporea]
MKRVAAFAALLALVAVFTPSPTGPVHLAAVSGYQATTPAPSEEEPNRECRKGPEPRTCASSTQRPGAARREQAPDGVPVGRAPIRAAHLLPRVAAADHLHTRLTPPVLQVFRN